MGAELVEIAALFVEPPPFGVYTKVLGVEFWDLARDARKYQGRHSVVAHPPCERWGRYARGGPSAKVPREVGDDGGCFAAALAAVRTWGGVLEHPEASKAWEHFGLLAPPVDGGWVPAGDFVGWVACVAQGKYGHPAQKLTWLYAAGVRTLPSLRWGRCEGLRRLDDGFHSTEERAAADPDRERPKRLSRRECLDTPLEFRDVLIDIARSARAPRAPQARVVLAAG